jgi:hypothetical protein
MNERILQALHQRNRPTDRYYTQVVYSYSGEVILKSYGQDYALALVEFQQKVRDFDIYYKGYIILFKNKLQNEIIRVNL